MKTYYIYEVVYCTYQVPNKMNVEQVYNFIAENGNWNEAYGFTNKEMAFEQWEKSKLWAETELDHDYDGEEYFYGRVMVLAVVEDREQEILDYKAEVWKGLF